MKRSWILPERESPLRILISGGGTGGHIFPAVAIAQEIQRRNPNTQFLFIGAKNKMEMEKVPQAGFKIIGLDIVGFNRSNLFSNLSMPWKLIKSLIHAKKIITDFRPDIAIGTGGFASGPALWMASALGIPIYIQEQNAYAGITNKYLAKKAKAVFTAYPNMESTFPGTQIVFTGNPIRETIITERTSRENAKHKLGLNPEKLCIVSVGGSLGSRTLNEAWKRCLPSLLELDAQLIWQTGKTDYPSLLHLNTDPRIQIKEFISDMPLAYSAADIVVSRAGAIALSEIAVAGRASILVPFPYAAEDHQTKNAKELVNHEAATMIADHQIEAGFWPLLHTLIQNSALREKMENQISTLARPDATQRIVDFILKMPND